MKFAVLPAAGIGDGLLMQIAARHLHELGVKTVTCAKQLVGLSEWFPELEVRERVELEEVDGVILQHDNGLFAAKVRGMNKPVYTLFAGYVPEKHGPLKVTDAVFDRRKTMAENVAEAMHRWFPGRPLSRDNGLRPIFGLQSRKWPRRVLLHATSSLAGKNWLKSRFLALSERLKTAGFEPVFLPMFPTLSELAAFTYESGAFVGNDSGPGHLASNLGLPTVTVGPTAEHLALWRPGWGPNEVCHAPKWARTKWPYFVTVSSVFKQFTKLTEIKEVFS